MEYSITYNRDVFKAGYDRLTALENVDISLVNKVIKRIELLSYINTFSNELTELFTHEDVELERQLAGLTDTAYFDLLRKELNRNFKSSLSVVIMTFNEERCIERCISSIDMIADEIIVLDTGSTDQTVDIIKTRFPRVKVLHQAWSDDFSACRNTLIEHSSCDWIFQLDADEYISSGKECIREFLDLFYSFPVAPLIISPKIVNHDNRHLDFTKRIFRRKDNLKYFGVIHEEPRYDMSQRGEDLLQVTTEFIIYHDGYQAEIIDEKNKNVRNMALQHKMIAIEPDNMRWHYFLAREQKAAGYSSSVIVTTIDQGITKRLNASKPDYFHMLSLILLAQIYEEEARFDELDDVSKTLMELYPNCTDGLYYKLIGPYICTLSKLNQLTTHSIQSLVKIEASGSVINQQKEHLYYLYGNVYWGLGNYKRAFYFYNLIKDPQIRSDVSSKLQFVQEKINQFLLKE